MEYVIIGGDAAGMSAAMQIFKYHPDAKITIFEEKEVYSYAQCGLPYVISDDVSDTDKLVVRSVDYYRNKLEMDAFINKRVEQIDENKKVIFGKDRITGVAFQKNYDKLLIASGGSPFIPDWGQKKLDGLFSLKTIPDVEEIKKYIKTSTRHALIVGGGYIALEVAESLKRIGLQVSMFIRSDEIGKMFDKEMQAHIIAEAEKQDVSVHFNEEVQKICGTNRVERVITNKAEYDADLVITATGILPNTNFTEQTSIERASNGAIKTDAYMQTNVEGVYAAGDCATQYHRIKKKLAYVPLGTHANKQGRIAGLNMIGQTRSYKGMLSTSILRFFDLSLGKTGLSEKEAKEEGFAYDCMKIDSVDIAGYMPNYKKLSIKAVYDKQSLQFLGAQIIGENGVDKRIDVIATALFNEMKVFDLEDLDLAYSPIYNGVWDPIHRVARKIMSKEDK